MTSGGERRGLYGSGSKCGGGRCTGWGELDGRTMNLLKRTIGGGGTKTCEKGGTGDRTREVAMCFLVKEISCMVRGEYV